MNKLLNFKLFVEARFQDIFKSDDEKLNSYKTDFDDKDNFLKFITTRHKGKKIRFEINYNHNINHDLKNRIKNRTSLKSITEFNEIFKQSLEELFSKYYDEVDTNGSYSLYIKEYEFSIILNIDYKSNRLFIKTIKHGMDSINVKNIIQINSTL